MKIDEIRKEWEKDSYLDETELGKESLRLPKLHSKYYGLLIEEKGKMFESDKRRNQARKNAYLYYKGILSPEQLKDQGREPFQICINKREEIDLFIDTDEEFVKYNELYNYCKIKIEFLESILKTIGSMQFTIKNSLDFIKIMNGIV